MQNREYSTIAANQIIVNRDKRQRRKLSDIEGLADSIRRVGLLNPVTITRGGVLIAGERRLTACRSIDPQYPVTVHFLEELTESETAVIELEENLKRKDLDWRDHVSAVAQIHAIFLADDPNTTATCTAERIGLAQQTVSKYLQVAERLAKNDARIANCDSINAALNIIQRENKRAFDDLIVNSKIDFLQLLRTETSEAVVEVDAPIPDPIETIQAQSIVEADFIEWAGKYDGPKFNFLHCDFPYGIGHDHSPQGGTHKGSWQSYDDRESVYWELCFALVRNLDRVLHPSAHMMFWLSMKFYRETVDCFEQAGFKLVMPQPLIWHKSDNKGVISDARRAPRNVYETALLFSRGDRYIAQSVSNCIGFPANKQDALHVSEKPEAMLRHFFRMFVDENCEMLDPTCGAGSAIRAANNLGAKRAVGIERDPDYAKTAQNALIQSCMFDLTGIV